MDKEVFHTQPLRQLVKTKLHKGVPIADIIRALRKKRRKAPAVPSAEPKEVQL